MPEVSFARDIVPLFRPVDIEHMKVHGVELDDYAFMSERFARRIQIVAVTKET